MADSERRIDRAAQFWITMKFFNPAEHFPSDFEPAALKAVVKDQSRQVGDSHVPHRGTSSDEENEEVLLLQSDILDDQGQFYPGKEENDP